MTLTADFQSLRYGNFKSYKVTRDVEDLSGSFSITLSSSDGDDPRFRTGDSVVIYANNIPILTGYVDKRTVSYGTNEHLITLIGRDKVADIVDSTIGHKVELKAPVTLDRVIQTVLKEINMSVVKVTNLVSDAVEPFTTGELVSGQIDETVFEFLEKYSRKRQVLMTTDGKGGFILTRAGQRRSPGNIIHRTYENGSDRNNVLEASKDEDDSDRFYLYRITSQGNPSASKDVRETDNSRVVNRTAIAYDKEIRTSRILDITAESSSDEATLQKRVNWEANIRRARSLTYNCQVQGHLMTQNGAPWEPNMLVRVIDDFAQINDTMLIKSVVYSLDIGGGSVTELQFVVKDSYLPEPEMAPKTKRHGKRGRDVKKEKADKEAGKLFNKKEYDDYLNQVIKTYETDQKNAKKDRGNL